PMLSSVWHDPAIHAANRKPGRSLYQRSIGRLLARFERLVEWLSHSYQAALRWSLARRKTTLALALLSFVAGLALPVSGLIGTEFVPQADYSETGVTFQTPVGSALELTESKARQVEAVLREFPEVQDLYT